MALWSQSGSKKTDITSGKLATCATEKHSVELKTTITQKAIQGPSEYSALGEEVAKGHYIGMY